jgi:hypothetical protein
VRGRPGTETARALAGFDEAKPQALHGLTMRSQIERSRSAPRGNAIFLHGITGADLAAVDERGQDDIWVNQREYGWLPYDDLSPRRWNCRCGLIVYRADRLGPREMASFETRS